MGLLNFRWARRFLDRQGEFFLREKRWHFRSGKPRSELEEEIRAAVIESSPRMLLLPKHVGKKDFVGTISNGHLEIMSRQHPFFWLFTSGLYYFDGHIQENENETIIDG